MEMDAVQTAVGQVYVYLTTAFHLLSQPVGVRDLDVQIKKKDFFEVKKPLITFKKMTSLNQLLSLLLR